MPDDSIKICDINLRLNYYTKAIVDKSIKMSNMLKINDEEVIKITKLFDWSGSEEEICRRLLQEYELRILILTKGTEGSYVFTPDLTSFLPSPRVHVADTVGAGDSFTAAFTAAYLNGQTVEEAHCLAAEVAAYVCQQHGAMPRLADSFVELFRDRG